MELRPDRHIRNWWWLHRCWNRCHYHRYESQCEWNFVLAGPVAIGGGYTASGPGATIKDAVILKANKLQPSMELRPWQAQLQLVVAIKMLVVLPLSQMLEFSVFMELQPW